MESYKFEAPQLGVFITREARDAIRVISSKRDALRRKEISEYLYTQLDKCLKMIAVEEISGKDFVICTPERGVGKTTALLKLCKEYGAFYITTSSELNFLKHEALGMGYKDFPIVALNEDRIENFRARTVLKSECVKLEDVRKALGDFVNIVGIEEI